MLTIILMILGYIVIGGITASVIEAISDDIELALPCGLIWPLSIPLLIGASIMAFIGVIIYLIIYIIVHWKEE